MADKRIISIFLIVFSILGHSISGSLSSRGRDGLSMDWLVKYLPKNERTTYDLDPNQPVLTLGNMNIRLDLVTLSGLGVGGVMAQQLMVAHSDIFHGVAAFQSGFYKCGLGNGDVDAYLQDCVASRNYNVSKILEDTREYSKKGLVDPLENLAFKRIYYLFGTINEFYSRHVFFDFFEFWGAFKTTAEFYSKVLYTKFLLPSDSYGGPCNESAKENYFIGNCNYSTAWSSVGFLVQDEVSIARPDKHRKQKLQPLQFFDQSEFFSGRSVEETQMSPHGLIYIPKNCQDTLHRPNQCLLHVHFHDIYTSRSWAGDGPYIKSGFLEVAELNNIIIIFPQAIETSKVKISTWDVSGTTGELYATKRGVQIKIIRKILERILGILVYEERVPQSPLVGFGW